MLHFLDYRTFQGTPSVDHTMFFSCSPPYSFSSQLNTENLKFSYVISHPTQLDFSSCQINYSQNSSGTELNMYIH